MAIQYADIDKLENDLTTVADAIREKTGSTDKLAFPQGFINELDKMYSIQDFTDLSKPEGELYSEATTPGFGYCCYGRTGITSINFPNATTIPQGFAYGCTSLTNIYLPKVTYLEANAFRKCNLVKVVLPEYQNSGTYIFYQNSNLEAIDLGTKISALGGYLFRDLPKLNTIIIRTSTFLSQNNSTTGFSSYSKNNCKLYVPSALVEEYRADEKWPTYFLDPTTQILPIEGSIYETHYVDGSEIV